MRKLFILVAVILATAGSAVAQDYPKAEIFGGCKVTGLPSGTSAHLVNYLFGPKLTYRSHGRLSPFAQVLFGGERIGGSAFGSSGSDSSFAMAFGGGADYEMTNHVAIRLIQAEYLYTKFGGTHQNNARISAGVVYRWGK